MPFLSAVSLHSCFERDRQALKLGHYETERKKDRERASGVCCFLVSYAFYTSSTHDVPHLSYDLSCKGRAVCDMHHTFIDVPPMCVAQMHTDASVLWLAEKEGSQRERQREGRDSLLAVHICFWVHLVHESYSVSATRGPDQLTA